MAANALPTRLHPRMLTGWGPKTAPVQQPLISQPTCRHRAQKSTREGCRVRKGMGINYLCIPPAAMSTPMPACTAFPTPAVHLHAHQPNSSTQAPTRVLVPAAFTPRGAGTLISSLHPSGPTPCIGQVRAWSSLGLLLLPPAPAWPCSCGNWPPPLASMQASPRMVQCCRSSCDRGWAATTEPCAEPMWNRVCVPSRRVLPFKNTVHANLQWLRLLSQPPVMRHRAPAPDSSTPLAACEPGPTCRDNRKTGLWCSHAASCSPCTPG